MSGEEVYQAARGEEGEGLMMINNLVLGILCPPDWEGKNKPMSLTIGDGGKNRKPREMTAATEHGLVTLRGIG